MCLTAKAFGMFLSIISLDNISVDKGRVTVHAPDRDQVWLAVGEKWCATSKQQMHAAGGTVFAVV